MRGSIFDDDCRGGGYRDQGGGYLDKESYDVPIKSNLVVEKDELYDVITSLETDFSLE